MIKIKFQVSETSLLESNVVIDKILLMLKKQNYIIEHITNGIITFKDDNWEMRSKNAVFRKVDKGSFEVTSTNEGTLIKYIYYISFLPEVIITAIIVFGAFVLSSLVLLIALPLWIQLGVRIYTLKDGSKQMIKRLAI